MSDKRFKVIFAKLKAKLATGDTASELKVKLLDDDPDVRNRALGVIEDISAYANPSELYFIEDGIIDVLLDNLPKEYALKETKKYQDNFSSTLLAIDYILYFSPKNTKYNWDLLIPFLKKSDINDVCLILPILGKTRCMTYIPVIEEYLKSSNGDIQFAAKEALKSIENHAYGVRPSP